VRTLLIVKNKEKPRRIQVTKVHKEIIINCLKLVILCVFVPLWQNYTFRIGLKSKFLNPVNLKMKSLFNKFGLIVLYFLYGSHLFSQVTIKLNHQNYKLEVNSDKFKVGENIQFIIENFDTYGDSISVEYFASQYENKEGIKKFGEINTSSELVPNRANEYHFLPMQIQDKDYSNIKITRFRNKNKLEESTFTFRNKGGLKFDVSSGFFVTNLKDKTYALKHISDTSKQILEEDSGRIRVGISILAHLQIRSTRWANFGFTGGFELNSDAKVGYLSGISLFLGHDRKFVFSAGAAFGKVKSISNLYRVNDIVSSSVDSVPTVDIWKMGWFGAMTYNF